MTTIHYFNPQNDLALANGSPFFTPPKAATALARAGACLPLWYAAPDDYFLAAVNDRWYRRITTDFGLTAQPTVRPISDCKVSPWGWSPATRHVLHNMGFDDDELPTPEQVEARRLLSSRVASAPVLTALMHDMPDIVAGQPDRSAPVIARSVGHALRHIADLDGRAMLKLPWSNAGRGQQDTARTTPDELQRRVAGMIARQGAIEITPYYHRKLDFAMLFDDNHFVGYSLFTTDTHGGWLSNTLLPDSEIERIIADTMGRDIDFAAIQDILTRSLTRTARTADYDGPTGVDFIIATDNDGNTLMPPVEINRRRTMGHVAHTIANQILAPGATGTFAVVPRTAAVPDNYTAENGRLTAGTLNLVPPGGDFGIIVTI